VIAAGIWVLYHAHEVRLEVQVIGDSPRAASYAGMRTRRKILAVMALSGAVAGIGGASQDGDFRHNRSTRAGSQLRATATRHRDRGTRALQPVRRLSGGDPARWSPERGYALQGVDFPSGLVGVMQGLILFCALGGGAADPLPPALRAQLARGGGGRMILAFVDQQLDRRRRPRLGDRLRHAAALRPRSASCWQSAPAFSTLASRG